MVPRAAVLEIKSVRQISTGWCCSSLPPLFRSEASYGAMVENNRLVNVSDANRLKNPTSDRTVGLVEPLRFRCGVNGEYKVDGWSVAQPTSN